MVDIVQQVRRFAHRIAHGGEQPGRVAHVDARVPQLFLRHAGPGGVVGVTLVARAVDVAKAGKAALHADGPIPLVQLALHGLDGLVDLVAGGVGVAQHALAARPAQELVERHPGRLGLDVPQRGVDTRDGGHRHRPAPPVGAAVEVLPDVLRAHRIATDQTGLEMLVDIGRDGQFAAVEGGVADAGEPLVGLDLHRDEVAPRRAHDDADGGDLHGGLLRRESRTERDRAGDDGSDRDAGSRKEARGCSRAWANRSPDRWCRSRPVDRDASRPLDRTCSG